MKQQFAAKHPWTILAAGAAIQVLTGLPAAWGVFQQPVMEEYGLSEQGAGYAFALLIAAFGVGCVLGGFLQDKKGPRCGVVGHGPALRRLFCSGLSAGLGRVGVLSGIQHPGGAGHGLFIPLYPVLRPKVVRGPQGAGDRGHRRCSGTFRRVPDPVRPGGAAGLWPGAGDPGRVLGAWRAHPASVPCGQCGAQRPTAEKTAAKRQKHPRPLPEQMLRTKQYWLCAGAVCFSTPAVLLFSPIILKLGMERGLDETAALWSIVLGSVGSAAGRMLMPMLSDHIGRRATDLGLFAASLGLSAAFWAARGWWVVVCYAGLTFCYSALAAVLPALSTDLFGLPHAGVNYGFLALGQSVGSLAFPFAANLLALENGRHLLAMAGAAAGFAAIWALHPVQKDPR